MKRFASWLIPLFLLAGAGGLWRWREMRQHRHDPVILRAARHYRVDPALVKAVVWRESRFNPAAVGRAGEIGLMQVTRNAGLEWAASYGAAAFDTNSLFDPLTNTMAGSFYLARGLKRYSAAPDPVPYALAEYNAGRSRVLRWMQNGGDTNVELFLNQMDISSTRQYVSEVMNRRRHYLRQFSGSPPIPVPGTSN